MRAFCVCATIVLLFTTSLSSWAIDVSQGPKKEQLRSAFLDHWPNQLADQSLEATLSKERIDRELKNHFDVVLEILHEQTDVSLRQIIESVSYTHLTLPTKA